LVSPTPISVPRYQFAFYLLNALPEIIVSVLLLSINLNTAFDIDGTARKKKESREMMAPNGAYSISNPPFNGGFGGTAPPMGDYAMTNQRQLVDETQNPLLAGPQTKPQGPYTGYAPVYGQERV
jgi:hypothetical protein